MPEELVGVIHGRTIELQGDPGIADGREVKVSVRVVDQPAAWGDGIRATAGCMADDPEFDAVMGEVQRARKSRRS